jgi:CheY-like chemotaxis protein
MPSKTQNKFNTVEFMIVDDDDVSVMAIQRSMKQLKLVNPVRIAKNGVEALEILNNAIGADKKLPPFIITLDLSMPKMGGLEFLERIRDDSVFNKLIIFVLTTSDAPTDIASAYEKNIAGYIIKEDATNTFRDALAMLNDYAQLVVLPH